MPWKVLGRKWHLLRKGFPSGKRVAWTAETLDKLFDLLMDVGADFAPDSPRRCVHAGPLRATAGADRPS